MALIGGTKQWVLTITGEVPPGVNEQAMQGLIHSSYAILGNLLPTLKDVGVTFRDVGPKLSQ